MITCTFENAYQAALRHVVVHAIVEHENGILLVKRSEHLIEGGKWGLPGGFLNRDETAQEGALRELYEETGWEGDIIALFRLNSNPHRAQEDLQNISFDFLIRPTKQSGIPDAESSRVEFIPFEKIYAKDILAFDHGETIEFYMKYRSDTCALPLIG